MPYEETEALIERGLIKVILPKGETLDENAVAVKADLSGIESNKKTDVEQPTESDDASDEEETLILAENAKREIEIRYRRSFLSRYIQAEPYIQDYYTEIKNELLSYKGVKPRLSWSKESFKCGRTHIAKMDVKGKALYLYLALDPTALDAKYHAIQAKGDCPTLIKIKSERKKKYAIDLIRMLMESLALVRIDREAEDYRMPYEETEALIERGLIKVILPKGETLDENAVAVKADLSSIELRKLQTEDKAAEESAITEQIPEALETDSEKTVEPSTEAEEEFKEASESIPPSADGINTEVKASLLTRLVSRGAKRVDGAFYAFLDEDDAGALFTVPYTKAQYLALPRKQRKSVAVSAKALLRYAQTDREIELLKSNESQSKKTAERIAKLEARLLRERKLLPAESLWADAVKRVVK